jgi:hypothetical protein
MINTHIGKYIKIVIGLIGIVGLFFVLKDYISKGNRVKELTTSLSIKDATIKALAPYKDKYGDLHQVYEETKISYSTAMAVMGDSIKHLADRDKIKPKQLTGHIGIGVEKKGIIAINCDSVVKAQSKLRLPGDTTENITYVPYREDIHLNIDKYWKRKWFAGHKHNYQDIWSEDNGVKVYSVQQYDLGYEYSPFSLAITAGMSIEQNPRGVLVVGIAYSPKFLRFKKRNK